jgi:hypothetical protein
VNEQLVGFLTQGGAGGVLLLVVTLILLGRLVPRSTVKQVREDYDDRLKEVLRVAAIWEKAYDKSESSREREADTRKEQEKALRECLEIGRASLAILQGVRNAAQGAVQRELTEGRD